MLFKLFEGVTRGVEKGRLLFLDQVHKRFSKYGFYLKFRPTIHTILSVTYASIPVVIISYALTEFHYNVMQRYWAFGEPLCVNTPAFLGTIFYHTRAISTPHMIFPQKKFYPFEYNEKEEWCDSFKYDSINFMTRENFEFTSGPSQERDREIIETLAYSDVQGLRRARVSSILKGFQDHPEKKIIMDQYNLSRKMEDDRKSGRKEGFGVFPVRELDV